MSDLDFYLRKLQAQVDEFLGPFVEMTLAAIDDQWLDDLEKEFG